MHSGNELLERTREVDLLGSVLDRLGAGAGAAVVLEGPAGAGKTTLLEAARAQADRRGVRVLAAVSSELERGFPYGVVRQLLEATLRGATAARRDRILAAAAAPAAAILMGRPEASAPEDFAADHALTWVVANLAAEAPLALLVDDLHWSDRASVRWLGFLARRLQDLAVGLVVTFRPGEPEAPEALLDHLRTTPGVERLSPQPLSREAVATLVGAAVPGAPSALSDAVHRATVGNPLYVRELVSTIHGETPADVETMAIPALAARVLRRVEALGPAAPQLASAMAVLVQGRLADAAAVAAVPDEEAAAIAVRLVGAGVLGRDDPFAFAHPLVRRSVADALTATERSRLHAAAADRLGGAGASPEAVAAHLVATRPAGSGSTASIIEAAGRDAVMRGDPASAARLFARALEEGAAEPPRWRLQVELGRASALARDPRAQAHLEDAVAAASGHPAAQADATLALAYHVISTGRSRDAREALGRTLCELRAKDGADGPALFELEVFQAVLDGYDVRRVAEFRARRDELEAELSRSGWPSLALAALLGSHEAARGVDVRRAAALLERAYADGALVAQRRAGDWAASQLLGGLGMIDALDRVLEVAAATGAAGRRDAALLGALSEPAYRGNVYVKRGDLRAAEADLRLLFDVTAQAGVLMWLASVVSMFADAIIERPDLADVATFTRGIAAPAEMLATGAGVWLLEGRARVRQAGGDRKGALSDLRTLVATTDALGFGPSVGPHRSLLALALPAHERERAVALVDEELARALAGGLPRPIGAALRARGILLGGEQGVADLRHSVEVLATTPFRLHHARSLFALGGALRRLGHRPDARGVLAEALALADRCGAERLVGQAEDELRAAGGRPRRRADRGVSALTASELRVARLAADGLSNVEIAQELFVTVKTVETHIGHVYAKLGLSGRGARRDLGAELESPGS